jgi:hypothetical protein
MDCRVNMNTRITHFKFDNSLELKPGELLKATYDHEGNGYAFILRRAKTKSAGESASVQGNDHEDNQDQDTVTVISSYFFDRDPADGAPERRKPDIVEPSYPPTGPSPAKSTT